MVVVGGVGKLVGSIGTCDRHGKLPDRVLAHGAVTSTSEASIDLFTFLLRPVAKVLVFALIIAFAGTPCWAFSRKRTHGRCLG